MRRDRTERPLDERVAPTRRDTVHTVEIDGEAVLLDEANGRLHLLNATGALVWACFDGSSSLSEIADDLSDALGVSRERVLIESLAIARHLADEGLLADPDGE